MSSSIEERAQEFGAMQGTVSALKENIDALAKEFRRFEVGQKSAHERMEALLREQLMSFKNENRVLYDALQTQLNMHVNDLGEVKKQLAQMHGERLHAERIASTFRWLVGALIAFITLLFGEHITGFRK